MLDHDSCDSACPSRRRPSSPGSESLLSDGEEGGSRAGTIDSLLAPTPTFRFLLCSAGAGSAAETADCFCEWGCRFEPGISTARAAAEQRLCQLNAINATSSSVTRASQAAAAARQTGALKPYRIEKLRHLIAQALLFRTKLRFVSETVKRPLTRRKFTYQRRFRLGRLRRVCDMCTWMCVTLTL
jgi:hypothetical protein